MSISTRPNTPLLELNEASIPSWKTQPVRFRDGREYIQIIVEDDNNQYLGKIFEVASRGLNGKVVIFKTADTDKTTSF
jgi:hypothetical protein